MLRCPFCDSDVRPFDKFCRHCANDLSNAALDATRVSVDAMPYGTGITSKDWWRLGGTGTGVGVGVGVTVKICL